MQSILHILEGTRGGTRQHVTDLLRFGNRAHYRLLLGYSPLRADTRFAETLAMAKKCGTTLFEIPMHRLGNPVGNGRAIARIAHIIRQERVTVVHAHGAIGGILGRLAAKLAVAPVIIYTPNAWPFLASGNRWLNPLYRWFERALASWTNAIICVSEFERQCGLRYRIVPEHKLIHIPNGIELPSTIGDKDIARAHLNREPHDLIIGTVTRFTPQKDPLGLLKSVASTLRRHPHCHCVMIGDGQLLPRSQAFVIRHQLQSQVHFLGSLEAIWPILPAFDIFVLPSRYEGLSYAVLEAMATGLPIITTAGGNEDAVKNGDNGIIVPRDNAFVLTAAINRLVEDTALRQRMGARSRQRIAQFTVKQMVEKTESLYDLLIKNNQQEYENPK